MPSTTALNDDFLIRQRPRLSLLTPGQCRRIHNASLEVLATTGVDVRLDEAVALLDAAGADTGDTRHVRIPSHLVDRALAAAPHRITIYDRNGRPAMLLEERNGYFGTGTDTPFVIDTHSGERRAARADDVDGVARLCDALPNIDFVGCMGGAAASEVAPLLSDRHNFARLVRNTTKPLMFTAWSLAGLSDIHAIMVALRGNDPEALRRKPMAVQYAEPVSPLCHAIESCQKLLFCARQGIPVTYTSGTMMGGTVPVTVAGAMVQSNAEFLSGLVLAQLAAPGAPVIYGGINTPMDMNTGVCVYNGPDSYLNNMMVREMASFYGLPDFNTGGCSDAKLLDLQAATEASLSIFQTGLAGSSMVHDVGYLESGMTACWELVVLADEIIDQVRHFLKTAPIDDDTLAVQAIDEVGPGGDFMAHEHTMRHFRDIWYPKLSDHQDYDNWARGGSRPLQDRLRDRVHRILADHHPDPLCSETDARIEAILERAATTAGSVS